MAFEPRPSPGARTRRSARSAAGLLPRLVAPGGLVHRRRPVEEGLDVDPLQGRRQQAHRARLGGAPAHPVPHREPIERSPPPGVLVERAAVPGDGHRLGPEVESPGAVRRRRLEHAVAGLRRCRRTWRSRPPGSRRGPRPARRGPGRSRRGRCCRGSGARGDPPARPGRRPPAAARGPSPRCRSPAACRKRSARGGFTRPSWTRAAKSRIRARVSLDRPGDLRGRGPVGGPEPVVADHPLLVGVGDGPALEGVHGRVGGRQKAPAAFSSAPGGRSMRLRSSCTPRPGSSNSMDLYCSHRSRGVMTPPRLPGGEARIVLSRGVTTLHMPAEPRPARGCRACASLVMEAGPMKNATVRTRPDRRPRRLRRRRLLEPDDPVHSPARRRRGACDTLGQVSFVRDTLQEFYLWYEQLPDPDPARLQLARGLPPGGALPASRHLVQLHHREGGERRVLLRQPVHRVRGLRTARRAPTELRVGAGVRRAARRPRPGCDGATTFVEHRRHSDRGSPPDRPVRRRVRTGRGGRHRDDRLANAGGQELQATLTKALVTIPTVSATTVFDNGSSRTGYVLLPQLREPVHGGAEHRLQPAPRRRRHRSGPRPPLQRRRLRGRRPAPRRPHRRPGHRGRDLRQVPAQRQEHHPRRDRALREPSPTPSTCRAWWSSPPAARRRRAR